jgi:hypothetical protein
LKHHYFLFAAAISICICGIAQSMPDWKTFKPGQYIDLNEYSRAARVFEDAWEKGKEAATALDRLNRITEREALAALWSVLKDPNSDVFYGNFTPLPHNYENRMVHIPHPLDDKDRIPSMDGLMGLRVVWQKSPPNGGLGYISAIIAHYFNEGDGERDDEGLPLLRVRRGPGTVRVRFEVLPFKRGVHQYPSGNGILGFSWSTRDLGRGKISIEAKSYVHEDGFLKYRYAGPCDFVTHCTLCHDTKKNRYSRTDIDGPVEEKEGFKDLVSYAQDRFRLSDNDTEAFQEKLKSPRKSFTSRALLQAIETRWEEIP